MKSIRRYLLLSLLLSMSIVMTLAAIFSYLSSAHEIDEVFDARLAQYTRLVSSHDTDNDFSFHSISKPGIQHKYESRVSFQVWNEQGVLLDASDNAVSAQLAPLAEGFHDVVMGDGHAWKVFVLHDIEKSRWIMAGESLRIRSELVGDIAKIAIFPLLAGTLLSLILMRAILTRGLSPLTRIADAITRRRHDDLSPIDFGSVPEETTDIVNNINALLKRIHVALERERRFSSNAAHELKTPLAALKLNLANVAMCRDETLQTEMLHKAEASCRDIQLLLEQLLVFNRLEPQFFSKHQAQVPINALCRDVLSQEAELALAKGQNLQFDAGQESLSVYSDPTVLQILLRNLVRNAILYTPREGNISLKTSRTEKDLLIEVVDNGPGIPDAEKEKVLERFYRLGGDSHDSGVRGTGLGLAIVKDIVELHRGQITLHDTGGSSGLTVRILLPLS
jgi:two-component system sensor histidine kinase QseC